MKAKAQVVGDGSQHLVNYITNGLVPLLRPWMAAVPRYEQDDHARAARPMRNRNVWLNSVGLFANHGITTQLLRQSKP